MKGLIKLEKILEKEKDKRLPSHVWQYLRMHFDTHTCRKYPERACIAIIRKQFTFNYQVLRSFSYSFDQPWMMKISVDLGATEWFWTQAPWIVNPAS